MKTRPVVAALAALVTLAPLAVLVGLDQVSAADAKSSPRTQIVQTGAATHVTGSSATLNGTVSPRGSATKARFEWGSSAAYGSSTPAKPVRSGRSTRAVAAKLTGLAANTTYHYRLVVTNAREKSYGADRAFTTSAAPTPTPTPTSTSPSPSPSPTPTPTSTPRPTPTPTPTPTSTPPPPPPTGSVCANPYFTTSDSNGGITDGGYYVHNNLWNAAGYPGTTGTTQVCSFHSWNHIGRATNTGDGAVKTYPNVHKDYRGRTISSFPRLTSTFAATSPGVGIYNVGYDLWLNGVPNDEVMIWTDNHNQFPAGSRVAAGVSLSGYTWDVYATSSNGYIAFVPANGARITSGTLDLKAMLNYLVAQGRVAANATVDQVCYGVEIVDTGGAPATWRFTDFSITDS